LSFQNVVVFPLATGHLFEKLSYFHSQLTFFSRVNEFPIEIAFESEKSTRNKITYPNFSQKAYFFRSLLIHIFMDLIFELGNEW